MGKSEERRQRIFDKFKASLNMLVDNNIVSSQKDVYICPVCLKPHKQLNEQDPLTLEDAPPKSLGGKAHVLTCKSCNNEAGTAIDTHLVNRLRELDDASFKPGSEANVKVRIGSEVFRGTISVSEKGEMSMYHRNDQNHPGKLEKAMNGLAGTKLNIDFFKKNVIPESLETALLKTGYILLFRKFGYSLILDKCYDIVREQLKFPDKKIYPDGFWFSPEPSKIASGVYFVCDKGLECMVPVFKVTTGASERTFGVFLPLPINDLADVIKQLNIKLAASSSIELTLYPLDQDKMNYLDNIDEVKAMNEWIRKRKG